MIPSLILFLIPYVLCALHQTENSIHIRAGRREGKVPVVDIDN